MWNSDKNLTPEEKDVMREFEYTYFMYNPGFRSMWYDNFEEYFKGTLDEKYWEKREKEREKEIQEKIEYNMRTNPEYANRMHEMAIFEETLFGDPDESYIAKSRWFERQQLQKEMEEYEDPNEKRLESDKLYHMAKKWSQDVLVVASEEYEKTKDLNLFRISTNCLPVSGKIVFASNEPNDDFYSTKEDFLWRTDRIGYILSLASLQRCIESFRKLERNDKIDKFISNALVIQKELIDRIDILNIKYLHLKE